MGKKIAGDFNGSLAFLLCNKKNCPDNRNSLMHEIS